MRRTGPWMVAARVLARLVSPGFGFVLLTITYIPIILIVVFALNSAELATFPLERFTLHWFQLLLGNDSILEAFRNSVVIGVSAVVFSVIVGGSAAFFLYKYPTRLAGVYQVVILLPFILPGIFTGIALLLMFATLNVPRGLTTVFIGHVVFCTAVVYKNVAARLQVLSRSLAEASFDLGASSLQTFFRVILPNLRTAFISGALLAFVLSFDETLITFFLIGPQLTLPLKIWGLMRARFTPEVHALAAFVFLSSAFLVLVFSKYILGRDKQR